MDGIFNKKKLYYSVRVNVSQLTFIKRFLKEKEAQEFFNDKVKEAMSVEPAYFFVEMLKINIKETVKEKEVIDYFFFHNTRI